MTAAVLLVAMTSTTVCSGPNLSVTNVNYVGNRAPLANTPFIKLPVGAVQPKGWLLEYLKRQRNGLTGNLGKISAWLEKDDNAWLSKEGKGKWGWEEVPYWLKGYGNLGYILKDPEVLAETKVWLDGVLNSQRADGNFGPTMTDDRGSEDFWPKMIMLYCLQSYYEATQDQRVLGFMTKFFRYQLRYPEDKFMQMYWQSRRIGDNIHSVLWLYNQTGDKRLLDLARKIHRRGMDWTPRSVDKQDWFRTMGDWHNVNIAQGFREPAVFSQLSQSPMDRQASYDAFKTVRKYFGQVPGGMFGSDENARPGYADPRQGVETCGMVEQMNSDEELLRITGDPSWADHAENVAFNSYPAAVMPDFKSLRYITSPNMVLNDDKDHHPGIANSGPFLMMNPFSSRCCQHNHAQGWPYFAENLFQATSDNGVAAVIFAASEATVKVGKGTPVKINLDTTYPFESTLTFNMHLKGSAEFPFYVRVPAWCDSPSLRVNGSSQKIAGSTGKYVRIQRTWKEGDKVVLDLPMRITTQRWEANQNSVSVNYGPLTFSLKIGEEYVKKDSAATAIGDSKWQKGADAAAWPSYEIHPTTAWNYGLDLSQRLTVTTKPWPKSNFPFTLTDCPIEMTASGKKIPGWTIDKYGLCGTLMPSPVATPEKRERITLVPMGAARLRISAFPTVK